MKKCLSCAHAFQAPEWQCPECGHAPEKKEGILFFAPALAVENDGFEGEAFDQLQSLEEESFWFAARNKIILSMLRAFAPKVRRFMEIGCGTGFVLRGIHNEFPEAKLLGTDIFMSGLRQAEKRLGDPVELYQMDARSIPFTREFDAIGAFDCIEHIEEDETVLSQIYDALVPGGIIILTVPQHMLLWSYDDEAAHHKRRYARRELQEKLRKKGFCVLRSTSFVSILFPLMLLSRCTRGRDSGYGREFSMPRWMNRVFSMVMAIEYALVRVGMNFPFGGSRLVVALKPV